MAIQKKTSEADYSMQEKILALYELQKIDSEIDAINKVKGELPLEVEDLEDEMAGLTTRIEKINAEMDDGGKFCLRLNAFCKDHDAVFVREVYDLPDEMLLLRRRLDLRDEGTVDLEIPRHVAQEVADV